MLMSFLDDTGTYMKRTRITLTDFFQVKYKRTKNTQNLKRTNRETMIDAFQFKF